MNTSAPSIAIAQPDVIVIPGGLVTVERSRRNEHSRCAGVGLFQGVVARARVT